MASVLENISVEFTKLTEITSLLRIAVGKRKNCFTIVCFVDYANRTDGKFPWLQSDGIVAYRERFHVRLKHWRVYQSPCVHVFYIGELNETILSVIQIDQHTVKLARLNHAFRDQRETLEILVEHSIVNRIANALMYVTKVTKSRQSCSRRKIHRYCVGIAK